MFVPEKVEPVGKKIINTLGGAATSANQTNGIQQTKIKETYPTDSTKTNGSLVLGYTGDKISTLTETIDSVQYQITITWTGDLITGVSEVVQL